MNCKNFLQTLIANCQITANPSGEQLRQLAAKSGRQTEFGSLAFVTTVKSRSAKFTEVIMARPNQEQEQILASAANFIAGKKFIRLNRTMGQNPKLQFHCQLFTSANYPYFPYYWYHMLFPPKEQKKIDLTTIIIPEWPEKKILVDAVNNITVILGTDYIGECKKSFLRLAMWLAKQQGGLGLHAGSKLLQLKDSTGQLIEKGLIFFGLSGTGKTTLTVHNHNLKLPEKAIIRQDDIIMLMPNNVCYGTENSYYIKTEGLDKSQEAMYHAATQPNAIMDNIYVDDQGRVDFSNYELNTNGRCLISRQDIPQCDDSIDLPHLDKIFFITRRYDIQPLIAKLTPEAAAAAFMLGESIETSAGDPTKTGQSKREVGTNPFIIGDEGEEGNLFLQLLKKNPQVECFVLNTGWVGGEKIGEKITIADSQTIIKEVARGGLKWQADPYWRYLLPQAIPGIAPKKLDAKNYYPESEFLALALKLKQERIAWLNRFPNLKAEIKTALFR